jgi:uncharacterized protein involved in exopolysaccharide biosynthesis
MIIALNRALADAAPLDGQIALRTSQLKDIDDRLRALSDGQQALQDLDRERGMLDDLVHTYRTRYEEARINEELDRQNVVSVRVIQDVDASEKPAKPRHLIFAAAGVVAGVLGAAALLLYFLVFREILITSESVERILRLPVLASVPVRSRR